MRLLINRFFLLLVSTMMLDTCAQAQEMTRLEREERQAILSTVYDDIRREYYDPKFHGVNWAAKYEETKAKVANASTKTDANLLIAAMLENLNDSHTSFIPPRRAVREDYGFQYKMYGDHCFITRVKPGSDAEAKGIRPGDEVLTINGFTPARESLHKMKYVLTVLYPQIGLRLELHDPSGKVRKLDVMAKEKELPTILTGVDRWRLGLDAQENRRQTEPVTAEFGDQLIIIRLSNFFLSNFTVDALVDRARQHSHVIVDLRGNPGGSVDTLKRFLEGFFEQDQKIGDDLKRDKTTPVLIKGRHGKAFTGQLFVLIDSESASAAEIFSRIIQVEKRGTILGDTSSGHVMAARFYPHTYGTHEVLTYGVEISVADFLMPDGKSLEHVGVTPDEKILPSAEDLAAGRDSMLSRAAEKAGVALTPEKAAELFPVEWQRE
jgi:C-terminal processing protease CtpA/Prc